MRKIFFIFVTVEIGRTVEVVLSPVDIVTIPFRRTKEFDYGEELREALRSRLQDRLALTAYSLDSSLNHTVDESKIEQEEVLTSTDLSPKAQYLNEYLLSSLDVLFRPQDLFRFMSQFLRDQIGLTTVLDVDDFLAKISPRDHLLQPTTENPVEDVLLKSNNDARTYASTMQVYEDIKTGRIEAAESQDGQEIASKLLTTTIPSTKICSLALSSIILTGTPASDHRTGVDNLEICFSACEQNSTCTAVHFDWHEQKCNFLKDVIGILVVQGHASAWCDIY